MKKHGSAIPWTKKASANSSSRWKSRCAPRWLLCYFSHDFIVPAMCGDEYVVSMFDDGIELENEFADEDTEVLGREAFLDWLERRKVVWSLDGSA